MEVKTMSVPNKNILGILIVVSAAIFLAGFVFLKERTPPGQDLKGEYAQIKSVNTDLVCMVNDRIMGKPQIPVPVGGKTYYGCCQGCVKSLQSDPSVRFTKDLLTGSEVDKASAFIVEGPSGEALYFESRQTAQDFLAPTAIGNGS
jgi:YHS domain-containing protein